MIGLDEETDRRFDCADCGKATRTVVGFAHTDDDYLAAYTVRWHEEQPAAGAAFEIVVGPWGEEACAESRATVSADYISTDQGFGFSVIDACLRRMSSDSLSGHRLARDEVVGTPLAQQVFAVLDAIFMKDSRLGDLRSW